MGNETFLLTTAFPAKPAADARDPGRSGSLLLGAKNSIPLFWYMLFDLDCLVSAEGPAESGEAIGYFALTHATESALALARERWPRVRLVLGPGEDGLFEGWVGFVGQHAKAYLHCETWEWSWLFRSPRAFRSHLRTCLAAFDHVPRLRQDRAVMNRWWRELLGQCGAVDHEDDLGPLGGFNYCGVSYGVRTAPWGHELRNA